MKPLFPVIILAFTILQAQGFGQTLQQARASAERDLRSAIGQLGELRLKIEREKIPLSKKVTDLETFGPPNGSKASSGPLNSETTKKQ